MERPGSIPFRTVVQRYVKYTALVNFVTDDVIKFAIFRVTVFYTVS